MEDGGGRRREEGGGRREEGGGRVVEGKYISNQKIQIWGITSKHSDDRSF